MQVSMVNNLAFTSFANPIKPYKLKTDLGYISVREINYIHRPDKAFFKNLVSFFLDNFVQTSNHPYLQAFRGPNRNQVMYDSYIKNEVKNINNALNSHDTTILVAKDKSKNIVGAIYAKKLHEGQKVVDCNTLYVDSLAVDSKYRGQGLGASMLNSVLDSSKNRFTDAFLTAYREAIPFYYKLGFKSLGYKKPDEYFIISEMSKNTDEYPMYVDYLTTKLNEKSVDSWCSRVVKRNHSKV
jgi:ribosomal protein S18 acetylase RimI-like enzyme